MSEWQLERREIDRRSIITKEARERMRRISAREQLREMRRDAEGNDVPDADDESIQSRSLML